MVNASEHGEDAYAAPVVSFALEDVRSTCRSGTLTFSSRHDGTRTSHLDTPALIPTASRGAVNHLTPDNFARCGLASCHLALEHFLDSQPPAFSRAPFALDHFLGLAPAQTGARLDYASDPTAGNRTQAARRPQPRDKVIVSLALRPPLARDQPRAEPPNSDNFAVALGSRGIVRYIDWTLPRPPDLLFALADEPLDPHPSKKRLEKSVRRSYTWLDQVARRARDRTNVFATLVGSDDLARRSEFSLALVGVPSSRATAAATTEDPTDTYLSGYVVPSLSVSRELLEASLAPLPQSKPRIALAPRGPHAILRAIRDVGIDVFVEEWSQSCATYGIALDFDFPVPPTRDAGQPGPTPSLDVGINLFETRHALDFSALSTSTLAPEGRDDDHPFGPAVPTRSYVHHLLLAHEMTAHVILSIHNQLVMQAFMSSIRRVLVTDGPRAFEQQVERFEEAYRDRTESQEEYECVERAKVAWTEVDLARGKGSMKDKVIEA
ncbi:uncharacterized protein JCM15063_004997 [Sporobolomyces koalae]|uniref:uncharacterized protein n=1 Tax=Sporobolomyces koalae TaxID=500713 RepID=UPI003173D7EF